MKRSGGLILSVLCLFCLTTNVKAETYYTNSNGVEMTESQYNKMLQIFSERKVSVLDQKEFDMLKDSEIVDSAARYEKETYIKGEYVSTEEITEEEYEAAEDVTSCTPYVSDRVETSYKKLVGSLTKLGTSNEYSVIGALTWKKVPAYRSYDVFAYRFNHFNYSGFTGSQIYFKGNTSYKIPYYTYSEGYKALSNGAGVSMNLKDGSDITGYELTIATAVKFSSYNFSTAQAYISYQHSQANISRAESMDYTLDISGLGNVVKFNNSRIAGYHDGMDGVYLSVPIA